MIGREIKAARLNVGATQLDAAQCLWVTQGNYSKIEAGKITLNAVQLYKLARLFKVQVSQFYAWERP